MNKFNDIPEFCHITRCTVRCVFQSCYSDKMADTEAPVETENYEETLKDEEEDGSVHNEEELTEDAQALKDELDKIVVHPPAVEM